LEACSFNQGNWLEKIPISAMKRPPRLPSKRVGVPSETRRSLFLPGKSRQIESSETIQEKEPMRLPDPLFFLEDQRVAKLNAGLFSVGIFGGNGSSPSRFLLKVFRFCFFPFCEPDRVSARGSLTFNSITIGIS